MRACRKVGTGAAPAATREYMGTVGHRARTVGFATDGLDWS